MSISKRIKSIKKKNFIQEVESKNGGIKSDTLVISRLVDNDGKLESFTDYFYGPRMQYFSSFGASINNERVVLIPIHTPKANQDSVGITKIVINKIDWDKYLVVTHELEPDTDYVVIMTKELITLNYEKRTELLDKLGLTEEEFMAKLEPLGTKLFHDEVMQEFYNDLRIKYSDDSESSRADK